MKSATHAFDTHNSEHSPSFAEKKSRSSLMQYFLGAFLLIGAYLLTAWLTASPSASALSTGSSFAVFWLVGGIVTLVTLTIAAKR